jgi:hypothetical protein
MPSRLRITFKSTPPLLLQFLARELGDAHLLVAGTYRDKEMHPEHPLTRTLVELGREPGTARLSLVGLGEAELARMIEHLAGAPPPAPLVAALYHATEGNPFFAAEVMRFMLAEGRFPGSDDAAVPPLMIPPAHATRWASGSAGCRRPAIGCSRSRP